MGWASEAAGSALTLTFDSRDGKTGRKLDPGEADAGMSKPLDGGASIEVGIVHTRAPSGLGSATVTCSANCK